MFNVIKLKVCWSWLVMSERGIFGGLINLMDFECLDDKEDLDFWV